MNFISLRKAALTLLIISSITSVKAQYPYNVTNLGVGYSYAVNENNQFTGVSNSRAYRWSASKFPQTTPKMETFGTLGGTYSEGRDINDAGIVTGMASTSSGAIEAFISGSYNLLSPLSGAHSYGDGINNRNDVVGTSRVTPNYPGISKWPQGGSTTYLCDGSRGEGYSINETGAVCGQIQTSTSPSIYLPFVQNSAGVCNTIVSPSDYTVGAARRINKNSAVVGYFTSSPSNLVDVAFYYSDTTGLIVLPPLGGSGKAARAYGLSDTDEIVGYAYTSSGVQHATLWKKNLSGQFTATDLNSTLPANSGWVLDTAYGINKSEYIAASGLFNGAETGCALTPANFHGVDVSVYSGPIDTPTWQNIKNAGYLAAITQGWGGRGSNQYAQSQLYNARSLGMKTGIYSLLNFDTVSQDGAYQVNKALTAAGTEKPYLSFVAIDIEVVSGWGYTVDRVRRIGEAIATVRAAGLRPAVYTQFNDWNTIAYNTKCFGDVILWTPRYDNSDNIAIDNGAPFSPFGGWKRRLGKQYTGSVSLYGKDADLNIFDPEAFNLYLPPSADTNGDGCIDDTDLLNVINDFAGPPSCNHGITDLTGANGVPDGVVDDTDLLFVINNFLKGC